MIVVVDDAFARCFGGTMKALRWEERGSLYDVHIAYCLPYFTPERVDYLLACCLARYKREKCIIIIYQ